MLTCVILVAILSLHTVHFAVLDCEECECYCLDSQGVLSVARDADTSQYSKLVTLYIGLTVGSVYLSIVIGQTCRRSYLSNTSTSAMHQYLVAIDFGSAPFVFLHRLRRLRAFRNALREDPTPGASIQRTVFLTYDI